MSALEILLYLALIYMIESRVYNLINFKGVDFEMKHKDLVGQQFNRLLVVKKSDKKDNNRNIYWYCQCECGNPKLSEVTTDALTHDRIKSCGCSRRVKKDLIGKTFGRWTVIGFDRYDSKNYYWQCQCACDSEPRPVEQSRLLNGRSESCGCLARELTSERRKRDITGQKFNKLTAINHVNKGEMGISIWECLCECSNTKLVVQGDLTSGSVKSCGCLKQFEDLTGKQFGWLTVIRKSPNKHELYSLWECRCKCCPEKTIDRPYYGLKNGSYVSCGCYRYRIYDKVTVGLKFGRLTAIKRAYILDDLGTYYQCLCDCGNSKYVLGVSLRSGKTKSCGCLQKERVSETHYKGTSTISKYCRSLLTDWQKRSKRICKNKCVITGDRQFEIHHLYPFSKIIEEIVLNANIPLNAYMEEYTEEQVNSIKYWCVILHKKYGLGICLNDEMHKQFHSEYGYEFKVEDFNEFYSNITGKEFDINLSWIDN
ncbi:hypothetical protein V7056_20120 [Bacillus sp. JJ664]